MAGSQSRSSGGALAGSSATGFSTFNASRGPNAVLDQMWISFDIEHEVFVTAGKQHVKWGTGRFWTPTDYLHPIKRNPLDVFDARPGTTMLKLHFPWESRAWNFYAFGVYRGSEQPRPTRWARSPAPARAEFVEGPAELGLDVFAKRGQKPRVGVDFSVGVGDFDLYTDIGLRAGSDFPIVTQIDPVPHVPVPMARWCRTSPPQSPRLHGDRHRSRRSWPASPGRANTTTTTCSRSAASTSTTRSDTPIRRSIPACFIENQRATSSTPAGTTRRVFASLPAPYSWNYTTFTLSTIGNLSDKSFVSRLDYSVTLLTHLTFEAFAAVHYGHLGGEFRLGLDIPRTVATSPTAMTTIAPAIHANAPIVDLGVALRLAIYASASTQDLRSRTSSASRTASTPRCPAASPPAPCCRGSAPASA